MSERGSVKRMTQIFLRKSELAFPVFGSQRDRGSPESDLLSPLNLLVTRSIASLAYLQPAGLARSRANRSRESPRGIRKRSKETMRLNSTSSNSLTKKRSMWFHRGGYFDIFIHELFFSKGKKY